MNPRDAVDRWYQESPKVRILNRTLVDPFLTQNVTYSVTIIINTITIISVIPETKHVSMVYSVAGILWSQFMVHLMLFPAIDVLYLLLLLLSTP